MTVLDICEPLFQRICQLNRLAREGAATPAFPALRREIVEKLDATRQAMQADPKIERHWRRLELPLIFFVDSMISESRMPAASEWNQKRLAYERRELAGDQKFFDQLDETLSEDGEDASTQLGVFFTCLAVGFTGWYANRPDEIRSRMQQMIPRVDPRLREDSTARLCPETYENLDTRDLIEPPPVPTIFFVAIFAGLCLLFIAVSIYLYQESTLTLREDLLSIISHAFEPSTTPLRIFPWL